MTTPPLFEHPELFALGVIAVLLIISYITERTLRWRAGAHQLTLTQSHVKVQAIVLGLHLFVMLGGAGLLAAIKGLPATGNLVVVIPILTAVYLPPLVLGTAILYWFLQSQEKTDDTQSQPTLSLRDVSITFGGWNLAIYPLIGVLYLFLA